MASSSAPAGQTAAQLSNLGVPVIHVFPHGDDDGLTLLPDDKGGAVLAVEHLLSIGRTHIAHITGPEDFEAVRLRGDGYTETLAQAGVSPLPIFYGKWTESFGRAAIADLYGPGLPNPDALFCGNYQIAWCASDALREMGLKIPLDVAIVGFDNWQVMAEAARP